MKTSLRLLPFLLALLLSFSAHSDTIQPPTTIDKELYGWVIPFPKTIDDPDLPPIGSRVPPAKLCLTVTDTGIEIPGLNTTDILLYEILDLEGYSVGIFTDGLSFVEMLFSLSGEYEVRFHTESYVYVGYVEL